MECNVYRTSLTYLIGTPLLRGPSVAFQHDIMFYLFSLFILPATRFNIPGKEVLYSTFSHELFKVTSPLNRRAEQQERDHVGLFRSLRIHRLCGLMARWHEVKLFQHLFFCPQSFHHTKFRLTRNLLRT